MEEMKKIEDIVVMGDTEHGSTAVLKGATLVEDIILVRDYAVKNNIPYYVAIKEEKDGSEKRYGVNENGTPVVLEAGAYATNVKYVPEDMGEIKEAVDAGIIEFVGKPKDEIVEEPVIEAEPVIDEVVDNAVDNSVEKEAIAEIKVEFDELKLAELVKEEADKIRAEYDKVIAEKDAEIAQLKDKIETLEIVYDNNGDFEEASETTLDDVIDFMRENGLTSLSIKGE